MNTKRELTINELDAVSGGVTCAAGRQMISASIVLGGVGDGGGGAGPAVNAWNTLLRNYGY